MQYVLDSILLLTKYVCRTISSTLLSVKLRPTLNLTKGIKIYEADIVNTFSEGEAIFINTT